MSEAGTDTRTRIIGAAIECIEQYGVEGATIRRIAAAAGVNIAAISYYFRSKDTLLAMAFKEALKNAFDWEDLRDSESLPAEGRLVAILDHLMEGAIRYPGTTRALFYETVMRGRYRTPAMQALAAFMEQLLSDIKGRGVGLADADLRIALVQVVTASMVFAAMLPRAFERFAGLDLSDPSLRRAYLERLVSHLLSP